MDKKVIEINSKDLKGSLFLRLRDIAIVKHYGGTIAIVIPVDGKEEAAELIKLLQATDARTD